MKESKVAGRIQTLSGEVLVILSLHVDDLLIYSVSFIYPNMQTMEMFG